MNMILIFMILPYENIVHIRHVLPCTRAPKNIYNCNCENTQLNHKSNLLYMCLKKCILCKNRRERRPSEGKRVSGGYLYSVVEVLGKTKKNKKRKNTKALG